MRRSSTVVGRVFTSNPVQRTCRAQGFSKIRSRQLCTTSHRATSAVPRQPIPEITKLQLRDYQEECIQSVLSSFDNGHKRLGISLATGAGKTVIFTQLIDRIAPLSKYATKTLILAHRRELIEQAARHCNNAYPDKRIDIEMGSLHASGAADITIASIQSITSGDRIEKFNPKLFKLVLVDEAHHIVAPGYMRVLAHFGLSRKRVGSPHLVGVSATFSRFDGLKLGAAIDEIVYHKDYIDMIADKWLSNVIFTTVESTADLSRVRGSANRDFQTAELSEAVNTDQVNEITVRSWMAQASERKSTLVFCVDLAHVAGLTRKFREHGIEAQYVTGDMDKVERSKRLEGFKKGHFPVMVNCGVFTEGTDIPNIDCVVLARPTRSRNLLVQMIGRGMRLHPGKHDCHVIDMVTSLRTGIVTTPTLFGLDPDEIVNKATVADLRSKRERKNAESARAAEVDSMTDVSGFDAGATQVSLTEYDSVLDLIADTSGERHIRSISQYTWVQVNPDRYILSGPTGTYLKLEREWEEATKSTTFRVVEIRKLPAGVSKSPYAPPRELLQASTFADAVHGADTYAAQAFPHIFISRWQSWRDGPPTNGQLEFLNKVRGEGEPLTATNITKGVASEMITKLKHGARGRFAGIEAGRRRKEKIAVLGERLRARETVAVGPVPVS